MKKREINEQDVELQSFSQTIPCECGNKFKLKYNSKRKTRVTNCPKCGKDYNYYLQEFIDNQAIIGKLVYDSFYK